MSRATTKSELSGFSDAVLSLRSWEKREIPLFAPQIALDVLLHISSCESQSRPAKMKDVHLAIGYSQDRIREIVKDLVKDGWVDLGTDPQDGRSKLLKPTSRSLSLLEKYRARLLGHIGIGKANSSSEAAE